MAGLRRGYRKPVKTGKANPIQAVKPGSLDDLMQRYDATIRRAKKERQTTTMLFEATVQINDIGELQLLSGFLSTLTNFREDPFQITPEVKAKTEAAMKFDELVPADDPPEATSGPTWAPQVGSGSYTAPKTDAIMFNAETFPTEDEAVEAFKKYSNTRSADEWKTLLGKYQAARVKDITPSRRAEFIAEASRAT